MFETDLQLLARYKGQNAEDAFAEIVRRHLDLVFSAALRQVRSPQLAQEVAQSVFTKLARQANGLTPDTILTAWLYQVTRRTAIDMVRHEVRRQFREQVASELIAMNATSDDWTQIEPLLDDAMLALEDIDRTAVLLRFFENKSLREVGQALGTNEDAARKRVSRAVERLREFFVQQGAGVSLGGIAVVISANAVQAAPAGLTAAISTTALAGTTAGAGTMTLLKTMAMTKLKAGVISSVVAASVLISLVTQHNANARIRTINEAARQQANHIVQSETENQQLSNFIALAHDPSGNNQTGLRNLRDKTAALQKQTNDLAALQNEERLLQSSLTKAVEDLTGDTNSQTTANAKTNELHARIFYAMDLAMAAHSYAWNHDGQFPFTCDEAATYMSAEDRNQTNYTPDQFEIVYHGTLEGIEQLAHPARIILVKDRQSHQNVDGKGVIAWSDLRAVGHYYSAINGDFDTWQKAAHRAAAWITQSMKKTDLILVIGILAAAVAAPWLIRRHVTEAFRANEEALNQQASHLAELAAENERLSNVAARTKNFESLSRTELQELLRLRSEVAQLQGTIQEMGQLRGSIGRLRDRLQDAATEHDNGRENDKALLADESVLRRSRVTRLKHWLEGMPRERIPELQFISEQRWMEKVDSPLITDNDYREAIGILRTVAESIFARMAFKAVKQYAQANHGQFPSDVSQLQPYFPTPIDDSILQRYEVVPANSLIPDLAQTGGNWLITQKAPVNKTFDIRLAIGTTSWRGRGGGGSQWDPVP